MTDYHARYYSSTQTRAFLRKLLQAAPLGLERKHIQRLIDATLRDTISPKHFEVKDDAAMVASLLSKQGEDQTRGAGAAARLVVESVPQYYKTSAH